MVSIHVAGGAMLLKETCTVCGERVHQDRTVECDSCGERLHDACVEFEQQYECQDCGDETWIGALEF